MVVCWLWVIYSCCTFVCSGGRVERVVRPGGYRSRRGRLRTKPTATTPRRRASTEVWDWEATVDRQRSSRSTYQRHPARFHRVPRTTSTSH